MIRGSALAMMLVAGVLSGCGTGPRVATISVPPGGPQNAQDMVNTWDATKKAESRCTYEQAGEVIGVDPNKSKTKTVTPACGDYK